MSIADREKVIALFEKHRKVPGEAFDEGHFLDYLLASPSKQRAVYNSFSGLRRFNAFIDDVQLEFSICFSIADREANYALDQFLERIQALKSSRRSSIASFRNQRQRGFGWSFVVILNFIFLVLCVMAKNFAPVVIGVIVLAAITNAGFLWLYVRERAYDKRLLALLQREGSLQH